jgi:hypothetical protein
MDARADTPTDTPTDGPEPWYRDETSTLRLSFLLLHVLLVALPVGVGIQWLVERPHYGSGWLASSVAVIPPCFWLVVRRCRERKDVRSAGVLSAVATVALAFLALVLGFTMLIHGR